jgi:nucleoside 2-deoxyribosyltransferase
MYERISKKLKKRHVSLRTVIGTKEVGALKSRSDIDYSDIATFKAQNRDLHHQFVSQIQNADVVVADLTHNNPNVHVELGIALSKNHPRKTGARQESSSPIKEVPDGRA